MVILFTYMSLDADWSCSRYIAGRAKREGANGVSAPGPLKFKGCKFVYLILHVTFTIIKGAAYVFAQRRCLIVCSHKDNYYIPNAQLFILIFNCTAVCAGMPRLSKRITLCYKTCNLMKIFQVHNVHMLKVTHVEAFGEVSDNLPVMRKFYRFFYPSRGHSRGHFVKRASERGRKRKKKRKKKISLYGGGKKLNSLLVSRLCASYRDVTNIPFYTVTPLLCGGGDDDNECDAQRTATPSQRVSRLLGSSTAKILNALYVIL